MATGSPPSSSGLVAADWGGASGPHPLPRHRLRVVAPDGAEREHARAAQLIGRAKQVVRAQFDALRGGGHIDVRAIRQMARDVARSISRNRYAVIGLSRLRTSHEYTYVHSVAVSALMIGVARELRLPEHEVDAIGVAGMLHDVGKATVPVTVLDKPGPLSDIEWATMKTHPERGAAILRRLGEVDPIVVDVALHHHERMDGRGYPDGLAGPRISVHARIAAVCDVYDALTSKRAYKEGRPAAQVLAMMSAAEGQFDPVMLRALRSLIGSFHPGTLVRLQRGQLGVVLNEVPVDPLCPRVRLLWCADTRRALPPSECDTQANPIVAVERIEDWPMLGEIEV